MIFNLSEKQVQQEKILPSLNKTKDHLDIKVEVQGHLMAV